VCLLGRFSRDKRGLLRKSIELGVNEENLLGHFS
jgi:hypothetical protein